MANSSTGVDSESFGWKSRAVASFGAASIVFFPAWREIFWHTRSAFDQGFIEVIHNYIIAHSYIYFLGGLATTIIFSLVLFVTWTVVARSYPASDKKFKHTLAWLAVGWGLLFIFARSPVHRFARENITETLLILVAVLALLAIFRRVTVGLSWVGVNIFAAIGLVFIVNAAVGAYLAKPVGQEWTGYEKQLAATTVRQSQAMRVVWLVFDEWDQRISFSDRRDGFDLPNVDQLRQRAFSATSARQAADGTLRAIPGMTIGKPVAWAEETATDGLEIRLSESKETVYWNRIPTLFNDLRNGDKNIAILTHYFLADCRQFAHLTTRCWEQGRWWTSQRKGLGRGIVDFIASTYRQLPITGRAGDNPIIYTWLDYPREHRRFLEATKKTIEDPSLDFVYSHWMIPHAPFRYNASEDKFLPHDQGLEGYWDNLRLVDNVVGELLSTLKQSGLADRTILIIGSDHGWRGAGIVGLKTDQHVPFIVAMPGKKDALIYPHEFSLLAFREMVNRLTSGNIQDYKSLAAFLSSYRLDKE